MFQCLVRHHLPCTKNLLSIPTNVSGELASLGMQWNVGGDAKWCTRRKEREAMRMQKTRFAISDWLSMWHMGFGPVTNQSKEKPNDSIAFRGRYWQPSLSRVIWWYFRTDILISRLISRQKTSTMTKNSILQLRSWKPGRLEWTIWDEIYQFVL